MTRHSEEDENKAEDQSERGVGKNTGECSSDVFSDEKDSNESSKVDLFPDDKESSPLRDGHKDSTTSSESLPPVDRSQLQPLIAKEDNITGKEQTTGKELLGHAVENSTQGNEDIDDPSGGARPSTVDCPPDEEEPGASLGSDSSELEETEKPKKLFERPPEEWLPIVSEENDDDSLHEGFLVESGPPAPPDGGWGWMVVLASFMIHVFGEYLMSSLISFWKNLGCPVMNNSSHMPLCCIAWSRSNIWQKLRF